MLSFSTMVAGAGFVLAGGASSRMGRNKAMMRLGRVALVERVAQTVAEAVGSAVLVGPVELYSNLGYPAVPDAVPGFGPVAGLAAAFGSSHARDWNLVVACDMPAVTVQFLRSLLANAPKDADCLIPFGPGGRPEPLCALYHRDCLPPLLTALSQQIHKVMLALSPLRIRRLPVDDPHVLTNLNTPEEFNTFERTQVAEE